MTKPRLHWPLVAYLLVFFVAPLAWLLSLAVREAEVPRALPRTLVALQGWSAGQALPGPLWPAFAQDLVAAREAGTLADAARRLNYEVGGVRSSLMAAARRVGGAEAGTAFDAGFFGGVDENLAAPAFFAAVQRARGPVSAFYLLSALDLGRDARGDIERAPEASRIYLGVLGRTLGISLTVTLLCLALGFPVALLLTQVQQRTADWLMILVLLPFWTSLLVRTTAWVVLLQTEGPVNDLLLALGLTDHRLQLIFSRFGTIVAMTHIQLPFTLLPIYSVMKTISPNYVRAARSLGAGPFSAFWQIYFPQTMPGIAAGCLLTFILCLGYYITPALVGGPTDQMISYFVANYTNRELNWGQASALGAILLLGTLILYAVYNKLVGIDKMKLG